MVDFCLIPPTPNLSEALKGDRFFCLAHLVLKNPEYAKFYKDRPKGTFLVLDNGAAEGEDLTVDELLEAIELVNPDEVIAKDVLLNGRKTIVESEIFIGRVQKKYPNIKIMAVPQGSNFQEWLECYVYFLLCPGVDTIGLSKISVPHCFKDVVKTTDISKCRQFCVLTLFKHELLEKPIHLLGMGDPNEYSAYVNLPCIRSTDSAYSFVAAKHNQVFSTQPLMTRFDTEHSYFDECLTTEELCVADFNIKYLRRVCHDKASK
jgi:hypothetical protein